MGLAGRFLTLSSMLLRNPRPTTASHRVFVNLLAQNYSSAASNVAVKIIQEIPKDSTANTCPSLQTGSQADSSENFLHFSAEPQFPVPVKLASSLTYNEDVVRAVNEQISKNSCGRLFAVVHVAGRQFKITEEDLIVVQGYWAPDIGDRIRLEKVLLLGSSDFTLLGQPLLPRDLVRIEATVIEKTLSHTKLHFRHKPRKNFKRLYFQKSPYSILRINLINCDELVDQVKEVEGLREKAW